MMRSQGRTSKGRRESVGEHGIVVLSGNQTSASLSGGRGVKANSRGHGNQEDGIGTIQFRCTKWAAPGGCGTREKRANKRVRRHKHVCDIKDGVEAPGQAG